MAAKSAAKKAPPFTKKKSSMDDESAKSKARSEVVAHEFHPMLKDEPASSTGMPGTDCTAGNGQGRGGQSGTPQG
jgi:hypothetical protein